MNKQGLADCVHGKLGGTKVQAEEVVDGLFGAIIDTLKKGGEVSIAGFGIFILLKHPISVRKQLCRSLVEIVLEDLLVLLPS